MRNQPVKASWWIVGINTESPALAVDLLDANSGLVRPSGHDEPYTMLLSSTELFAAAELHAIAYAQEHGVPAIEVHYDPDSTAFFAND